MGWQRSVVATCGGVVVAAVLARYIGLPILVALEDIFVPELDSAFRPEPTHPLIFGAASLAAIGSCFLLGGLTAALAAPLALAPAIAPGCHQDHVHRQVFHLLPRPDQGVAVGEIGEEQGDHVHSMRPSRRPASRQRRRRP